MVVPRVALHISRRGHVAAHTFAAGLRARFFFVGRQVKIRHRAGGIETKNRMMTMGHRINGRCVRLADGMAAQAHHVAGQFYFGGVNVVAVQAAHAVLKHFAAHEGGHFVILVANLAVGVKEIRFVGDGKQVMVKKVFTRSDRKSVV